MIDLAEIKQVMAEAGYTDGETAFKTTLKYWREWAQMPTIVQLAEVSASGKAGRSPRMRRVSATRP